MSAIGEIQTTSLRPFLKWAGGKRWFVDTYSNLLPTSYNRYIEPFLGSGAVFFSLIPAAATLSDTNKELIDTYQAIVDDWELVIKHLRKHQQKHSDEYYYKIRSSVPLNGAARAARLIYLNRTCWNGLYRVNKKGQFNVPKGSRDTVLFEHDDFARISGLLRKADLICQDFEVTIESAKPNDLIFADPPYTVKHGNNGFLKYNETLFSWDDQIRLKNVLLNAARTGVHVVLTNANHESIRNLYSSCFQVKTVDRKSLLAANASDRKSCKELVIISR
ncbi:MAG: Dam family site-specific DNA-(adenine-N6)-methyltransferase [Spirochaetales bacterium]|jgi:DNA adenine methylase|nr:Dam family site-specific DNA-(adenine-N6)-methyltransferase [Spirochaetales bacterium]